MVDSDVANVKAVSSNLITYSITKQGLRESFEGINNLSLSNMSWSHSG